jgi:DNA-binding transcriptional LysR family regulator
LPRWLAGPEITAGRLVEKALAEPRQELPLNLAWRSRQTGRALAWFLDRLAEPETAQALTHGL